MKAVSPKAFEPQKQFYRRGRRGRRGTSTGGAPRAASFPVELRNRNFTTEDTEVTEKSHRGTIQGNLTKKTKRGSLAAATNGRPANPLSSGLFVSSMVKTPLTNLLLHGGKEAAPQAVLTTHRKQQLQSSATSAVKRSSSSQFQLRPCRTARNNTRTTP